MAQRRKRACMPLAHLVDNKALIQPFNINIFNCISCIYLCTFKQYLLVALQVRIPSRFCHGCFLWSQYLAVVYRTSPHGHTYTVLLPSEQPSPPPPADAHTGGRALWPASPYDILFFFTQFWNIGNT
jgi:hypothetical protein